jgi:hypothetical protein
MNKTLEILSGFAAVSIASAAIGSLAIAQNFTPRAPTAADWAALAKLPDFAGVWETASRPRAPQAGGGRASADVRGTGARGGTETAARRGGPGGAGAGRGSGPALTPEYAAKRAAALANPPEDGPAANCLPPGMPGIMGQPYPMEFLLTPGQVTILIEAYNQIRHIYTDGRKLPGDPDPTFHGTSVGHWDGDTLVAETVGFSPLTQIASGVFHSDKMRIVERFRLADPDTMTIETTISDPEALTSPYTTSLTLRRHRDWTLAEYICEQNNRNFVDENGKAGIKLGAPGSAAPKK